MAAKIMREIFFDGAGGPEVIRLREAPVAAPGPGQVLVEVVGAGVNRPDCLQRAGHYPPPAGESEVTALNPTVLERATRTEPRP